jgi:hypothetical protein
MKNKILLFLLMIGSIESLSAQGCIEGPIPPPVEIKNGVTYWGGLSVNDIVDKSDLLFEGRILSDSVYEQAPTYTVCTYHRVLVLKQFKGIFKSDTIIVVSRGGKIVVPQSSSMIGEKPYCHIGDEALFLVTNSQHVKFGGNDPNIFWIFYGPGVSYVTVCDKKDVVSEVYEPIENVTGQGYVDVHPNSCKTQKQKK